MRTSLAIAGALSLLGTFAARANPLDMYGLGARGPAMGNAVAALADDATAAYYNPAGLALRERPSFTVGYSFGVPRLGFDGDGAPVETARGVNVGLVVPRSVAGTTVAIGAALYFPDQRIVRVRTQPATLPRFAQYDNRLHRIAVHPGIAWRPYSWLSFGAGISILADAKGQGADFDVALDLDRASDPQAQRASARLDVELPTRIAPVLGVWAWPHPRLRLGLVYRGALSLDVSLQTRVAIDAGLLQGTAVTGLASSDYYSPDQLTLGVAFDATPSLRLAAEATWYRWSAAPSPVPRIEALLDLGLPVDVVQSSIPSEDYQPSDVVSVRLGVEARVAAGRSVDLELRGGFVFEPTPYPRQTGVTSLADNDKFVLTAGAGVVLRDLGKLLRGPLRFDAYLQAHILRERLHPKDDPAGPTPSFRSGGFVIAGGVSMGVGF